MAQKSLEKKTGAGNLNLHEQMFLNHGNFWFYHDKRHPRHFQPFGDGKDEEMMREAWKRNKDVLMAWEGKSNGKTYNDPGFPTGTKPWAYAKFEMPHVEGEEDELYLFGKRGIYDKIRSLKKLSDNR